MKHTLPVTALLITFFLVSQLFGLFLIQHEVQPTVTLEENQTLVSFDDSVVGDVPTTAFDWKAIPYLVIGIGVATGLILLLRRLKFGSKLWKVWYFLAVFIAMGFAMEVILVMVGLPRTLAGTIGSVIALIMVVWKLWKNSFLLHNLTELLMYTGISVFFVVLFNNNILYAGVLLLLIAAYDAYAVWKSKHMIALAKFTVSTKVFPGFMINYKEDKQGKTKILQHETTQETNKTTVTTTKPAKKTTKQAKRKQTKEPSQAILGGGDVVFPLIFAGVVLGWLVNEGIAKTTAYALSLPIVAGASFALILLFTKSQKGKFYPAMPFIGAGCLVGYGITWLLLLI